MRIRRAWSHRGVLIVVIVALLCAGTGAAVGLARSSSGSSRRANAAESGPTASARRAALARAVAFSPARNAVGVEPNSPIVVSTRQGWLSRVDLVPTGGPPAAGSFSVTARDWLSTSPLMNGTTYQVTAVVNDSGVSVRVSSKFRTMSPAELVNASVFPTDGLTVGIGQPIAIRFDHDIVDTAARAALLSHITITESNPVPGGWHWFSDHEVHFRPRSYWPAGERVTIAMNLNGWNAGNQRWGNGGVLARFAIGDAHVSVADLATHHMTVRDNGRVVADYAISGGSDKYPTMNGMHIVMDRQSVVHMVSSTVGIPVNSPDGYDELVYADVHISDSGEYVHAAPWSVDNQGSSNVSHGCINLSNPDALAFFGFSRVGDIVQVVGGPRPPEFGDHGVMDWDTPWDEWAPAIVTPEHPAPPPPDRFPAH